MIYLILGASGSGKTACLETLKNILPNYAIYDFDDVGVPENADQKWRQESTEKWIKQLTDPTAPVNVCLLGQMVPGEILGSPSVNKLKTINICLLDCDDVTRIKRLKQRNLYNVNQDTLNWAAWLRMHCVEPQWEQHVIKEGASPIMHFDRWDHLVAWDEIMNINVVDTSHLTIEDVAKQIASHINLSGLNITIKQLSKNDIKPLSDAFLKEGFNKLPDLFQQYLQEQTNGRRSVWIAIDNDGCYLGYITIMWQADYSYFATNNIPEIKDLNVVPSRQNYGIGTMLLNIAEKYAAQKYNRIGIAVGLFKDYGPAQSLYIKKGYVPNKEGITYDFKNVIAGNSYPIDDDCLLWLTKKIDRN